MMLHASVQYLFQKTLQNLGGGGRLIKHTLILVSWYLDKRFEIFPLLVEEVECGEINNGQFSSTRL